MGFWSVYSYPLQRLNQQPEDGDFEAHWHAHVVSFE